jgi:hypothetical protein
MFLAGLGNIPWLGVSQIQAIAKLGRTASWRALAALGRAETVN